MKVTGRVVVGTAERIQQLPPPFLGELEGLKRAVARRGKEIIDLGRYVIRVDLPQSQEQVALSSIDIRRTFSDYLADEHHAVIDPERQILLAPGSRIALLLMAAYFIEGGTICYVPDPGYDAYRKLTLLFGGKLKLYPLYQRNDYLPNLEQFDNKLSRSIQILFINSPHNPTGAVCDQNFYTQLQRLAVERNILVVVDSSYALSFAGNFRPPLFCESAKRLRVGIEMFSFSTNLCAPDLKLTALVGRRTLIEGLAGLAKSLGCTPPTSLLRHAGPYFSSSEGLRDHLTRCRSELNTRMNLVIDALKAASIEFYPAPGAGFVWVKLKRGRVSLSFTRGLLRRKGVAVVPGSAFGGEGEGWVRIAANVGGEKLREALDVFVRHYQPIKSRLKRSKQ